MNFVKNVMTKNKLLKIRFLLFVVCLLLLLSFIFLICKNKGIKSDNTEIKNDSEPTLCSRDTPYKTNPEFDRGLSLLYQRIEENKNNSTVPEDLKSIIDIMLQIRNCLNVQYGENASDNETEGFFVFDPESSSENLQVFVNKKYSDYDDALTALLLVHEITHAAQFVNFKFNNIDISCVDKEVEATRMEFRLLRSFKYTENTSIQARIAYEEEKGRKLGASFINKRMEVFGLEAVNQLLVLQNKILNKCEAENVGKNGSDVVNIFECAGKIETGFVKDYIVENPFYKEQCDL